MRELELDGLFRPRGVAVIGASQSPHAIGAIIVRNLLAHRFTGAIYPVNPKGGTIHGLPAYPSVLDVPGPVDLANIAVAHELVPAIVDECGRKGVRFCIVHSAGYREVGGAGVERERELVALARRHGLRIFGPNSQGVQSSAPEVSLYANFTFVPMRPGNISIIAQGGGMGELLKLHLERAGVGHRLYASYGNECDVTMPELLEYFGQDPGTRVIMLQTESFKDPAAFLRAAARITPGKPILALKAGRTAAGQVAVASHTGALVDEAAMATAVYLKAGVLELHDSDELIKAAIALGCQEPPAGGRLAVVTNTGSPAIHAVDEAVDQGLTLATLSAASRQRLAASLHPAASLGNPIDVVATATADHWHAAVDTVLADEGVDLALVFLVTAPFIDAPAIARRLREAIGAGRKPTAVVVETGAQHRALVDDLRGAGVPVYEFPEDGARALAALARWGEVRRRRWDEPPALPVDREGAARILAAHRPGAWLPQDEACGVLAAYGIPTARAVRVTSAAGLAAAAACVGFPCVLKVDHAGVIHRSDAGGVALELADAPALAAAFAAMAARFAGAAFVVQEQHPPGRELLIGARACPGLGALVACGLGGRLVEIMRDVRCAVAPVGRAEARDLVASLRCYPVLAGVRGEAPVDLPAVEDVLLRVARLAADFPSIAELDLNPLLAYPAGTAPVAVDVRLRVGAA